MRWLADLLYLLVALAYLPVALYNALILGKNRHGWKQRFGGIPKFDPDQPRIWIHAVSLGEINCTPRLVEALRERLPDCDLVFSTTTDTGYVRAVQLYGEDRVFRFPLDFSAVVSRALERVQPSMIVLVELEVWYNLIGSASSRGIPIVVINGRLTERSAARFQKLGIVVRSMFEKLTWVGAQDENIGARFRALGVPASRIEVTSSLKWDTAEVTDFVDGETALAQAMGIDRARPLWVCGSTGPGEEAILLDAYRQVLRGWQSVAQSVQGKCADEQCTGQPILAIVPRKPERFDEVARAIARAGFVCVRRSEHSDGKVCADRPASAVFLGDTMGELRKFYSLANIVFVGRTLVPMGGSDPIEVAALGKPVIMGPYTDNFQVPVQALAQADAVRVVHSGRELPTIVGSILRDGKSARTLGSRAREVVVRHKGATQRTAERIVQLFGNVRS